MASENLVNELFEIVQANSNEKIYYNDFEKDLLTNINLPNDEIDKALMMIISQAEINPDIVGETKGGSFILSQSLTKSIVSTIEYEKVLVERKNLAAENAILDTAMGVMLMENADKLIDNVIITDDIAKQMIDNYENLTAEEVGAIWDNYDNLDVETKEALREARKKDIQKVIDDPNATPEVRSQAEKDLKLAQRFDDEEKAASKRILDPLRRKKYIEFIENYREDNPEVFKSVYPDIDKIEELSDEMIIKVKSAINRVIDKKSSVRYRYSDISRMVKQNGAQELAKEGVMARTDFFTTQTSDRVSKILQSEQSPNELGAKGKKDLKEIVYGKDESEYVYIISALDRMHQEIELPDEEKLSAIELLGTIIEELGEDDLKKGESHLKEMIKKRLDFELKDINYVNAVLNMLDTYDSLIPAIIDNRDGVIERVFNPYVEGIREGKDIIQIMSESYRTVDNEFFYNIQAAYQQYTLSASKLDVVQTAVSQEQLYTGKEEKIRYNSKENFKQYGKDYTQTSIPNIPITDAEYGAVKKKEESLSVDEDGLKKALTALEKKDGVTQEIPSINGENYGSVLEGISPELAGVKNMPKRRRTPKTVVNQTPNEETKSEITTQIDSHLVAENSETKEVNLEERQSIPFYDPRRDGVKKVKEVRAESIREQTEALKEAAKYSEQSLSELIEQEKNEEPVQE